MGFKLYHFDSYKDYQENYDSARKIVFRQRNHFYMLEGIEVINLINEKSEQYNNYYLELKTNDGKEFKAKARIVKNAEKVPFPPWDTGPSWELLSIKKGDKVKIGGYFFQLKPAFEKNEEL